MYNGRPELHPEDCDCPVHRIAELTEIDSNLLPIASEFNSKQNLVLRIDDQAYDSNKKSSPSV